MNGCGNKSTFIQQGDQYAIPIYVQQDELLITPDNCSDLRIQIGNVLRTYSKGELTYNSEEGVWEFPLTEEMSRSFGPYSTAQVGIKIGNDYVYSRPVTIEFGSSLITEGWS